MHFSCSLVRLFGSPLAQFVYVANLLLLIHLSVPFSNFMADVQNHSSPRPVQGDIELFKFFLSTIPHNRVFQWNLLSFKIFSVIRSFSSFDSMLIKRMSSKRQWCNALDQLNWKSKEIWRCFYIIYIEQSFLGIFRFCKCFECSFSSLIFAQLPWDNNIVLSYFGQCYWIVKLLCCTWWTENFLWNVRNRKKYENSMKTLRLKTWSFCFKLKLLIDKVVSWDWIWHFINEGFNLLFRFITFITDDITILMLFTNEIQFCIAANVIPWTSCIRRIHGKQIDTVFRMTIIIIWFIWSPIRVRDWFVNAHPFESIIVVIKSYARCVEPFVWMTCGNLDFSMNFIIFGTNFHLEFVDDF